MILIPMMGKSSRFYNAGYLKPKYMLPIGKSNLFKETVLSFKHYFESESFIFTIPNDDLVRKWIIAQLSELNLINFKIIAINNDTNGQADTIYQTLRLIDTEGELNIFNIDTILRNFKKNSNNDGFDGYLEVFCGDGDHWSFAKIDSRKQVIATSEKVRISPYCSNGFYNFKNKDIFFEGFFRQKEYNHNNNSGEIYIAPIYNFLIDAGYKFGIKEIDIKDIVFSGTPNEYESMLKHYNQ